MSKTRVCFLGTPDFAVAALKRVLADDHYEVVGVVTQPDRPSGRKLQLTPSPVKQLALAQGLRVISPESIKEDSVLAEIQSWTAEVAIVVAYGQILPQKFLDLFQFGAVNIHGSVLPRWRGAAPIQRALEAGDTEGGVTLQKVVKALDAGDIIGIRRVRMSLELNAKDLYEQLATLGAETLHIELMDYIRGNLAPVPQDESLVTYAKKIEKSESEIHWDQSALKIHNKVRAFVMGPGTWTLFQGKKLKIHRTSPMSVKSQSKPGTILILNDTSMKVATGEGVLELFEVQPESRNRMTIAEFAKGYQVKPGDLLGI